MVGGTDPKQRKHFSFELILSEPKLKAKLSLDIKNFRAVNNCRNNFAVIYLHLEADSGDEHT